MEDIMDNPEVIGIITARKGSKGLKDKNIKILRGKPVVWHTIQHSKKSTLINRIVCSTDSPIVEKIASSEGIEVMSRPNYLAQDDTPIEEVLLNVISTLNEKEKYSPDILVLLYANVPIRATEIIDTAIKKLIDKKCDCVLTVTDVGKFHPNWMIKIKDDDKLDLFSPTDIYVRQKLPGLYIHDGAVIVIKYQTFIQKLKKDNIYSIFGKDIRVIVQNPGETVEIDNKYDLIIAEMLLRNK
jgi:CMP-N-acetylneuraminic acid synthetase|tara:strand:+ start:28062 stop:28784 length:723 start_codon:yes stop_codon:yes gene_type:complete